MNSDGNETIGMLVNSLTQQTNVVQGCIRCYTELTFTRPSDVTEKCHPGLHTPVPAGFYLNDVWTSFVCSTRHFTAQTTTECLKDKDIYMMGDSTMRQWFEFFAKAVPSEIIAFLLIINIYTVYKFSNCGSVFQL